MRNVPSASIDSPALEIQLAVRPLPGLITEPAKAFRARSGFSHIKLITCCLRFAMLGLSQTLTLSSDVACDAPHYISLPMWEEQKPHSDDGVGSRLLRLRASPRPEALARLGSDIVRGERMRGLPFKHHTVQRNLTTKSFPRTFVEASVPSQQTSSVSQGASDEIHGIQARCVPRRGHGICKEMTRAIPREPCPSKRAGFHWTIGPCQ